MTQTRNIMVMSLVIAIAGVALMPLMTNEAFAYGYAYAKTNMTYCNNSANYKTMVDQPTSGGTVTTSINVPSTVCGNSFQLATITVYDGNSNQCTFTTTSSNGSDTDSGCGGSYDINNPTIVMSVSLDYSNNYTVNYTQSDSTT